MTPPVRGRQRIAVVVVFAASAAATGALAGFVLGAAWTLAAAVAPGFVPSTGAGVRVAAAVIAAAAIADIAAARWARLAPVCLGRQVPQAWGRLFAPTTVAFLYGSRLGVGPATILSTWLWWAALLLAASHGPAPAALAGGAFGLARIAAVVVASTWAEADMAGRVARLARSDTRTRVAAAAVAAVAALVVAAGLLAGAGTGAGSGGADTAAPAQDVGSAADRARQSDEASRARARARRTPPSPVQPSSVEPDPRLEALLVDDIGAGWSRIPDARAETLGALDLAAAAAAERDVHAERALLETRRFRLGHARAWRGDDLVAYAAVYEFGSAHDAAAYVVDGRLTLEGRGADVYPLEEPTSALGFSEAAESPSGTSIAHGVVFSRGRHFFLVVVTGSRATAEDARNAALVQDAAVIDAENV